MSWYNSCMSFKHINLNLYEGGLFFKNIFAFFDREQPDVVSLQEVFDGKDSGLAENYRSLEILKNYFMGWEYYFAPEFMLVGEQGKMEIGNAIFSRYPITSTVSNDFGISYGEFSAHPPTGDFGTHPKNIQCCEIAIEGTTYTICNLHGIWGLDGGDSPERLEMSRRIVDLVKGKKKLILSGDFNLKPDTQTIRNIDNHLINVYGGELTTSFNLAHKNLEKYPGYATAVVDMVFASSDIVVLEKKVASDDVSDHLAFVIQFE